MDMGNFFFDTTHRGNAPPSRLVRILNLSLAFLAAVSIFFFAFGQLAYHWAWGSVSAYWYKFLQGWIVTVLISLAALVTSFSIGVLSALFQRSSFLPLRYLSKMYVEIVRGTPLLVQILIFFYVVADAFKIQNRYLVGVLILSFFSGAYICEIVRGGIEAIGRSQIDSARAIGLTRLQTYRYVIFPQAVRQILPALAGQFASLIKDSSLLSIISINEFTLNAQEVNAYTFSTLESYIPLAVGYLILTLPLSMWSRALERKFHYET
jgi:polar amino acid transport system permease protein